MISVSSVPSLFHVAYPVVYRSTKLFDEKSGAKKVHPLFTEKRLLLFSAVKQDGGAGLERRTFL